MTAETPTTALLPGENETRFAAERRYRRDCELCEEPARYCITFLLKNARTNPQSSAYGKDNIVWCGDAEKFACVEHKDNVVRAVPDQHEWCATFDGLAYPHMLLYWGKDYQYKPVCIPHSAICLFKDGNQWCAVFGDFQNLQESKAGFGETFEAAIAELQKGAVKSC